MVGWEQVSRAAIFFSVLLQSVQTQEDRKMAVSQMVGARVSPDMVQAIETLAIQRGMLLPNGDANISAAVRLALEVGLTSLRLEQRRVARGIPGRVHDVRQGGLGVNTIRGGTE